MNINKLMYKTSLKIFQRNKIYELILKFKFNVGVYGVSKGVCVFWCSRCYNFLPNMHALKTLAASATLLGKNLGAWVVQILKGYPSFTPWCGQGRMLNLALWNRCTWLRQDLTHILNHWHSNFNNFFIFYRDYHKNIPWISKKLSELSPNILYTKS